MDKQILTTVLMICLVASVVGAGTYAYFSDSESSTGNTFAAGTLDLKVSDPNEPFGDGVMVTWTMSNMVPGVTTVGPFSVILQNSGTIAANHVEINFSHSINEGPNLESDTNWNSTPGEMARWIQITSMTYNGVNFLISPAPTIIDANGNGFIDLDDVTRPINAAEGGPLDNLSPPPPNNMGIRFFTMTLAFNAGATNDIQGDILNTTVTFTLNQHSSQ